jgi:SAM-dependent methyltransferase
MQRVEYEKMRCFEDHYWWYQGLHTLVRDAIDSSQPGFRWLLDAGCGSGGLLQQLSMAYPGAHLVGIDVSPHAVELCRQRGLRALMRGSLNGIGLRPASFDIITCADVLYFSGIDERAAVAELFRLLRPGGALIVNVPAFEFLRGSHDRFVETQHRFTRGEVVRLLEAAGFRMLRATYWNMLLFPGVALVRLARRRPNVAESDLHPIAPIWNRMLTALVRAEARWVRHRSLPLGTSVFCVARKPGRG